MATEAAVYEGLQEIFADVFMRDIALRPDLTAADVKDWDSFKQIEIIVACEERYKLRFTTREVDSMLSLGDLAGLIVQKTA